MLVWARVTAQMSIEEVAKKLHVKTERIDSWESGEILPTVKQLRKLSKIYNQSFAAFYLPHPPKSDIPIPNDYRRNSGATVVSLSPELTLDIRTAWERRGIVLDLYAEQGEAPVEFTASANLESDPEESGWEVRELLGITFEKQKEWREHRIAFNRIREVLESAGILIFQAAKIPLGEIRGYSLSQPVLPIIVINRKDSYPGRIFTMLHELTHIMLRTGGLCDMTTLGDIPPEASKIEVFCSNVAGAA
ncbi:MAG: helix-turn-helix domain-containing protein [bacterium]